MRKMFCPNCGKADQQPESYCRSCGNFLPNLDKLAKKQTSPEEHLTINTTFSIFTAVVSLILAIMLYAIFLNKSDTHFVIYVTAGFLTAIFCWNVQVTWRNFILKKQIKRPNNSLPIQNELNPNQTEKSLPEATSENLVPGSVTEMTTKNLDEVKIVR